MLVGTADLGRDLNAHISAQVGAYWLELSSCNDCSISGKEPVCCGNQALPHSSVREKLTSRNLAFFNPKTIDRSKKQTTMRGKKPEMAKGWRGAEV